MNKIETVKKLIEGNLALIAGFLCDILIGAFLLFMLMQIIDFSNILSRKICNFQDAFVFSTFYFTLYIFVGKRQ